MRTTAKVTIIYDEMKKQRDDEYRGQNNVTAEPDPNRTAG